MRVHTSSLLASRRTVPRLGVLACVAVATLSAAVLYPQALADLTRVARFNATQSYDDREIAGGNAVLPDQSLVYEARARIPEDVDYQVVVGGPPVDGWSELTEEHAAGYARYFLLPRRETVGAPWVLCLACDRGAYPGEVVWEGEGGSSLIRRSA